MSSPITIRSSRLVVIVTSLVAFASLMLATPDNQTAAHHEPSSMQHLLERLAQDDITFSIAFVSPVSEGSTLWTIPASIEYDGNVIGRRVIGEIGEDYICVNSIGQGATDVDCIPFPNIAYIHFNAP